MLPLIGTEKQLSIMRRALQSGRLVSAESTLVGLTDDNVQTVNYIANAEAETVVVLPDVLEFIPSGDVAANSTRRRTEERNRRRGLASYTGEKKVLFVKVKVTDKNGEIF